MGACVKVCIGRKGGYKSRMSRCVLLMLIFLTYKVVHTPLGFDGGSKGSGVILFGQ
jgi:hypothetical protein